MYANVPEVKLYVDDKEFGTVASDNHVFRFSVPISGTHKLYTSAVIDGVEHAEISDTMEVVKVSEPNPEYFVSADKVRNWFDETEIAEEDGYFSLNSTMGEISANPKGKALLDQMMAVMTAKTAGGMGEGVKVSKEMHAIVARQPLKRLLGQVGIDLESDAAKQLNAALNQIKK